MILILIGEKILVNVMHVPELVDHTYLEYSFEPNTNHLHPVLYINNEQFKGNKVFINIPFNLKDVHLKVDLLDDNGKIVRTYSSNMPYNVYQILGNKPVRPDIEDYLYKLEEEIRLLKQTILDEKQKFIDEQNRLNEIIKEIEEKGEII